MKKQKLHILMLEDNPLDAELNIAQLELLEEYDCDIKVIQERGEYIDILNASMPIDIILCDYNLPQYNGMEALNDLIAQKRLIPFIFVTGTMQEEVAADAIKAGAWDYVVKDRLFRLPLAVRGVLKLKKEKVTASEATERTQRLLSGIEETSMQVIVLNPDLTIEYVNQNFNDTSGYKSSEVVGKPFLSFFPDGNEDLKKHIREILNRKKTHTGDVQVIEKSGAKLWEHYSITPVLDNQNEVKSYLIIKEDITRQKRIETELRETKERYDLATKIGKIGTWDWNIALGVLFWSHESFNILGLDPKTTTPSYELLMEIVHPDDRTMLDNAVKIALQDKKPYLLDYRIFRSNGEIAYCYATGIVEYNEKDEPVRMMGTFQDITERKKGEEELKLAKEKAEESDRLKTSFLANLSHEIRTPMNGILGFTGLLKEKDLSNEDKDKYISILEESGLRLLLIINDLVDISKIESNQIEVDEAEINLNEVIDNLYELFKLETDKKGLSLQVQKSLPHSYSFITTDNLKLEQVLSNLIKNALKFTQSGSITFGYRVVGDKLQFTVNDTGIGIPEDMKEVIFERFRQVDNLHYGSTDGSGLGLSISKAFIELLGGEIWVDSQANKGSSFHFTIPFQQVVLKKDSTQKATLPDTDQSLCILIAEDDEISYLLLTELFATKNVQLLRASTGEEALQLFDLHPETDLILMDIKMPHMNGIDTTQKIRESNKTVPIIAQTAFASEVDKQKAIKAGCNDFINKPIKKDILFEKIQKAIHLTSL